MSQGNFGCWRVTIICRPFPAHFISDGMVEIQLPICARGRDSAPDLGRSGAGSVCGIEVVVRDGCGGSEVVRGGGSIGFALRGGGGDVAATAVAAVASAAATVASVSCTAPSSGL